MTEYRLVNPHTEQWLSALESGTYRQGKSVLHDLTDDTYCYLGVACAKRRDSLNLSPDVSTMLLNNHPHDVEVFDDTVLLVPKSVVDFTGLKQDGAKYIIQLNDSYNLSFLEIAALVRSDPERFLVPGAYEEVVSTL